MWIPEQTDADAIHDNVAGEIAAVAEKALPVSADLLLIEDSAASYAKKKVQVGNLPTGGGGGGSVPAWGRPSGTSTFLVKPGMVFLGAAATLNHPADRLRYEPFYTPTDIAVDTLYLEVTTAAASSNMRLGIYAADENWQPTSLIFDSGNIATTSTGVKTATISPAATLTAGRYLTVSNHSHQISVRDYRMAPLWVRPTMGTTPYLILMSVAETFGALPDPGTQWDTESVEADGYRGTVLLNVSDTSP